MGAEAENAMLREAAREYHGRDPSQRDRSVHTLEDPFFVQPLAYRKKATQRPQVKIRGTRSDPDPTTVSQPLGLVHYI